MERFGVSQIAYFPWSQLQPQFILWPSEFCCQLSMCHIPALNKVLGNCVNHRSVIVVVPVEKIQKLISNL